MERLYSCYTDILAHRLARTIGARAGKMSAYDSRTTVFSSEGRLKQVEYAMKAVTTASTTLAIRTPEGVVLTAQRKLASRLLDQPHSEKLYVLDDHIICAVSGVTSDANLLIDEARTHAQRWLYSYDEPISVQGLVEYLANYKQGYTQYGGLRPFGVSFLIAGYDDLKGFQLYQTDPSGNYSSWVASSIGGAATEVSATLKQSIQDAETELELEQAQYIAVEALAKTVDITNLAPDKLELAMIRRVDGKPKIIFMGDEELGAICARVKEAAIASEGGAAGGAGAADAAEGDEGDEDGGERESDE